MNTLFTRYWLVYLALILIGILLKILSFQIFIDTISLDGTRFYIFACILSKI